MVVRFAGGSVSYEDRDDSIIKAVRVLESAPIMVDGFEPTGKAVRIEAFDQNGKGLDSTLGNPLTLTLLQSATIPLEQTVLVVLIREGDRKKIFYVPAQYLQYLLSADAATALVLASVFDSGGAEYWLARVAGAVRPGMVIYPDGGYFAQARPTVTAVEVVGGAAAVKPGSEVVFRVTLSSAVNVSGQPELRLVIGGASQSAAYVSGSGSNVLSFRYTVMSSEEGLAIVAKEIVSNGGSIESTTTLRGIEGGVPSAVGGSASVTVGRASSPSGAGSGSGGEGDGGATGGNTNGTGGGGLLVPVHLAAGIAFTDGDPDAGQVSGDIAVTKATDESDLTSYVLYWGTNASTKVSGLPAIATLTKTGSNVSQTLAANTAIPSGATHLLVYSKNSAGESVAPTSALIVDAKKKYVFVTSGSYSGNLGGLAGADDKCEDVASASTTITALGLPAGTIWKAVLGTRSIAPRDRIDVSGEVYNTLNQMVSSSTVQFWSETPLSSVQSIDENGNLIDIWTWAGSGPNGYLITANSSDADCNGWTNGTLSYSGGQYSRFGSVPDPSWAYYYGSCDGSGVTSLMCISQ